MSGRLVFRRALLALAALILCAAPLGFAEGETFRIQGSGFGFMLPDGFYLINDETYSDFQTDEARLARIEEGVSEMQSACGDALRVLEGGDWENIVVNDDGSIFLFLEIVPEKVNYGEADFSNRIRFGLWAGKCLINFAEIDYHELTVGEISLLEAGGWMSEDYYAAAMQARNPNGNLLRMFAVVKRGADASALRKNLLGLTLGGRTGELKEEAIEEKASGWRAYRTDYVRNADGEICAPELCGAEDALLLLGENGSGVLLKDGRASYFAFADLRRGIVPVEETEYGELIYNRTCVFEDDQGVFCYNAPWAAEDCLPHFVPEAHSIDTHSLEGVWTAQMPEEDASSRAYMASVFGVKDEVTIGFNADGTGWVYDSLTASLGSAFGESGEVALEWFVLDGKLYFFGDGEPFREVQYRFQDEIFELLDTEEWGELYDSDVIFAPILYEGEMQMRRWAGLWGAEFAGEGVYIFDLKMDGTMECRHISSWLNADILESRQLFWRAAEGGIEYWADGEEPTYARAGVENDLYCVPIWRDEGRIQRLDAYEKMMNSIPQGVSPEEAPGVWRAERIQVGADVQSVELRLNPDGKGIWTRILIPDGSAADAKMRTRNIRWQFLEDGRTIALIALDEEDEGETVATAEYAGGKLNVQIAEGVWAEAVRQAGIEDWNAGDYGAERLVNYMSTGLVGVWEATYWDAPQDGTQWTLRIYADPTGKAKATNNVGSAYGSWEPSGNGLVVRLRQELWPTINAGQDFLIKRSSYSSETFEASVEMQTITMRKILDYWEADFQASSEADFAVKDGVLTAYRGSDAEVVIPLELGISAIGEKAFTRQNVERVVLPEGVTRIGAEAFRECAQLTEVVLPKTLEEIGDFAFDECEALAQIELPDGLRSIGESAFEGAKGLTALHLPASLRYIGEAAFRDCDGITEIEIPFGMRALEYAVFSGCNSLKSVILPSGIQSIGAQAFSCCDALEEISLPEGVETIGQYAFSSCPALKRVEIPASVKSIDKLCFSDSDNAVLIVAPMSYAKRYCTENDIQCEVKPAEEWEFVLDDGKLVAYNGARENLWIFGGHLLNEIGKEAFANHAELKTVEIDKGVKKIGEGAFRGCAGLTAITIPDSVKKIGEGAFADCGELTVYGNKGSFAQRYCEENGIPFELVSSNDQFIVKDGALIGYTGDAEDVVIPDNMGITALSYRLFYQNSDIRSVTVPQGVTVIESEAFAECINLESIVLPEGIEKIPSRAFYGCAKLTAIVIPDSATRIGESAFESCSALTTLKLPKNLKSIDEKAFQHCRLLSALEVPEGTESIDDRAFFGCAGLGSAALPSTLQEIGEGAFEGCGTLLEIAIPDGVESLGERAFAGCSAMHNAIVPTSVKEIGEGVFSSCINLTLVVDAASMAEAYARQNGVPFEYASGASDGDWQTGASSFEYAKTDGGIEIRKYVGQSEFVHIPETIDDLPVVKIGAEAFAENGALLEVIVPEGVIEIGDMAFFGCTALYEVELPESAAVFGRFVFGNCSSLTLHVRAGSAAEAYAQKTNLNYTAE